MSYIRSGELRSQIDLMRNVGADDGKGGLTADWQIVSTVWAQVVGQNGREAVIAHVLQGVSVYRVTIRWFEGINPGDQLRYGAIDLNIRSVSDPDGRREALVIFADTDGAQATE